MDEIYQVGQSAIVFDDIVADVGPEIRPPTLPGDHILINGRDYIVTMTQTNPSLDKEYVEIILHAKQSPCSSTDRATVYEAEDAGSTPAGGTNDTHTDNINWTCQDEIEWFASIS